MCTLGRRRAPTACSAAPGGCCARTGVVSPIAGVLVVVQAAGMLAGPALVRYGIDEGVRGGNRERAGHRRRSRSSSPLSPPTCAGAPSILAVSRVGEAFLRELRERVFRHLLSLSMEFFDRNRIGSLVSRMTADIEALQELVGQGLTMFLVNSLLIVGAIVVMVLLSWQLALGDARRRPDRGRGERLVPA